MAIEKVEWKGFSGFGRTRWHDEVEIAIDKNVDAINANEKAITALQEQVESNRKRLRCLDGGSNRDEDFVVGEVTRLSTTLDKVQERIEALETKHEHHYHEKLYGSVGEPEVTRTTLPLLDDNCYVPDPEPFGRWMCDECGKDWGDGVWMCIIDGGDKRGKYYCSMWAGGCGAYAVTWHPEPKAFLEDAENAKGTEPTSRLSPDCQDEDEGDSQLKPCPFCGENATVYYFAECNGCGARGQEGDTKAEAIAAWNRRAADDEIERLKAENELLKDEIREQYDELAKEQECRVEVEAENERLKDELDEIVYIAVSASGITDSTPNAVGNPVPLEPSPSQMIGERISNLTADLTAARERIKKYEEMERRLRNITGRPDDKGQAVVLIKDLDHCLAALTPDLSQVDGQY